MVDWDELEPPDDDYHEYERDQSIDEAKEDLQKFFKNPVERKDVFYVTQLQVIFERRHYHWITYKAIVELVDEGILSDVIKPLREDQVKPGSPKVRFIFHPSCRSTTRQINRKLQLIRKFSAEDVSRATGRYTEILFSRGLMMNGFRYVGENMREYGDRKWEGKSDLDYIFERDNQTYGCEIKNRFEYMKREVIAEKIEICRRLGIIPLFIVREAPKSYIETVRTGDPPGFTLVFDTHIYSQGQTSLVDEIQRVFKGTLPVDCPRDLPGSIINRFLKWHLKQIAQNTP